MIVYILEQTHEGLGNSISFNVIENTEVIDCLSDFFRTSRMDGGALRCLCSEATSSVHTHNSKC